MENASWTILSTATYSACTITKMWHVQLYTLTAVLRCVSNGLNRWIKTEHWDAATHEMPCSVTHLTLRFQQPDCQLWVNWVFHSNFPQWDTSKISTRSRICWTPWLVYTGKKRADPLKPDHASRTNWQHFYLIFHQLTFPNDGHYVVFKSMWYFTEEIIPHSWVISTAGHTFSYIKIPCSNFNADT